MLRGATTLPADGLAALTNAAVTVFGGPPMLKFFAFDEPPPVEALNAITDARPDAATSSAVIWAVTWPLSTNVVLRFWPFQRITVPGSRLEPATFRTKLPLATSTVAGVSVSMDGWRLCPLIGIAISHTLRPWLPARSTRACRLIASESTATLGSPLPRLDQPLPPSVVIITPASVAIYKVLGRSGSTMMLFTGIADRLPLISCQVAPELVVL